jgi:arabinofuranan 3-O-arabinosyltransferase
VTRVAVRTAAGQVTDRVRVTGRPQVLRVPPGATGWLQLTVTGTASPAWFGSQVAIKEITVPGVRASRLIVAPAVRPAPATVVLAKAQPWPSGCMPTYLRWVCNPSLITPTEEQYGFGHVFTAGASGTTALHGSTVLISARLASKYLGTNRAGVWVSASSAYTPDPQDQARAAFDGDLATAWTASTTDARPILTIGWRHPRTVDRITIRRPPGAVGLLQVLITGSRGQVRGANVGASGVVRFAPVRTTRLTIRFTSLPGPLQISDVVIPGVPQLGTPRVPLRLRCGLGPALQVNGKPVPTRVWGTYTDVLDQRPLHFAACSPVAIRAGGNQVIEPVRDSYSVQDVVVGAPLPAVAAPAAPARILAWTSSRRVLRVAANARSYLVVNENFNPGWRAAIDGRQLRAVRLDGWKQAWLLPAGTAGVVTLTYRPNAIYQGAILVGLSVLALALFVAAGPWAHRRGPPPAAVAVPTPAGPSGRRPLRRAIVPVLARLVVASGLVLAGFWLGGYPGAVLLPMAVGVFLGVCRGSRWRRVDPLLVAGLMLAASAAGAVGEHLVRNGDSGLVALWLADGIPQIICLLIIGRLTAALIRPGPDQ